MAFGLTQWLISFAVFLIVLTVITWSAVHLGKKDQNATYINLRFLDTDNNLNEWQSKSLHSTIVRTSTSQVLVTTDGPTLFANDQGSEIPDSAQFYQIFRTFYSNESNSVNNANYDTETVAFAPSVVGDDLTWNDNITIYNVTSDRIFALDGHRNASGKVTILPDRISQTAHLAHSTHEATLFDTDKLWTADSSQSTGKQLFKLLRDENNVTSNVPVISPFTRVLSDAEQSNTTDRIKTIRIT